MRPVVGIVVRSLDFALFGSSSARVTPGKMAFGLVVADLRGKPITFGRVSGRYSASILSGLVLGVGHMMAGWTERMQALHELMAATLVIRK